MISLQARAQATAPALAPGDKREALGPRPFALEQLRHACYARAMSLGAVYWQMWRSGANTVRHFVVEQKLRGAAMVFVVGVVWALLSALFLGLLWFLGQDEYLALKARLLESLLALFFFTLFFLVTISDAVLVWSALFRTRAGAFQAALPLSDVQLYWAASVEGGFWAGWAVMVLVAPLVGSLATEAASPLLFVPAAAAVMAALIACCMAAGALGAMVLARVVPIIERRLRWILVTLALIAIAAGWRIAHGYAHAQPTQVLGDVIGRLRFAESPWLPPAWGQHALIAAKASRWGEWLHDIALLASTAGALAIAGETVARRRLRWDLDALAGRARVRGRRASRPWRLLPLLPRDLALLAAKDLRLFIRDPTQVMQFAMFFGLLGFYMLMLPRLGTAFQEHEWWRPVVSILNLTAVAMALATFTGRFVYPLLSLEGRRLWVLALAPWPRSRVVTAKLVFALMVALPVSVGLVVLSGTLLHLPPLVVAYQTLVIVGLAVGLAAGALGLGARLADYSQDNPAKLVAGYGGTVNLLASLVFSGLLISGAALPLILRAGPAIWALGVAWTLAISTLWTWAALRLAWRWFGALDRNPTLR